MERIELSALKRSPLLQAIGGDLVGMLLQSGSIHDYRRGEMVFWQGDLADSLFVVLSGCVKLCRETTSHDHEVIGVLTVGQIYFEPSMFTGGRHCVHRRSGFDRAGRAARRGDRSRGGVAAARPRLQSARHFLQTSRGLVEQVEQLKTRSVPQRIAALLLRQAELSGQAGAFVLPFSKTLIARFVGAKLESFSRSLGHLSEQGVQVHNDRVTIEDVGRLARYAGGPASDKPHERKPILTRFASMARRRRFDDALVRYWRKAQGAGAPISLLLIDVGPARRSPGDTAGDGDRGLLASVGDSIAREADRGGKFMVHYGDEIFAVAAPKADHDDAMALAQRIIAMLDSDRRASESARSIVAGIGSATIVPTARDHIEKIVCFADIALYRAKARGRGQICRFHDDPSCAAACASPSGGARIPVIELPHCSECRKDAPRE